MITAQRNKQIVTRNSSFFKLLFVSDRDDSYLFEDEDDVSFIEFMKEPQQSVISESSSTPNRQHNLQNSNQIESKEQLVGIPLLSTQTAMHDTPIKQQQQQ